MAQFPDRRPEDSMDSMARGSNPCQEHKKQIVRAFPSQTCCAGSLSVCPTPVCIRMIILTHVKDNVVHVRLQKHGKTQHALVGLTSAALAAAVALPM